MFRYQKSRTVLYLTVLLGLVMSLCLNQASVRAGSFPRDDSSNNSTEWLDASNWQKVVAPDGTPKDGFGYSAAISDDGNTAIVGTYYTEFGSTFPIGPGAVYVFINNAGTWALQQKLPTPSMPDSDVFGFSVALSANGNTALVGAQGDFGPPDTEVPGAAFVFTRSEGVWSQQTMLTASDCQVGDHFGVSVALSDSGDTALIGAYADDVGENIQQGSAYVYQRNGSVWTEQAHLISSDGATEDLFGRAVALSSDGNIALIGADFKVVNGNTRHGAAYIFTRAGAVWSQQTRLTDVNGDEYSWFGASLALSADGRTALVGADGTGAVVFTSSGDTWTQQTLLTIPDVPLSFGDDIAISADGRTALLEDGYTFRRCGNTWLEGTHLQTDEDPYPYGFGLAVTLSYDGSIALIGAPFATIGDNQKQGAAYFFPVETPPCPDNSIYLPLIVR